MSGASVPQSERSCALGAADWLCLAAAPTFAIMALLTASWRPAGYALLGSAGCVSR